MIIGVSGHRTPRLGLQYNESDEYLLIDFCIESFEDYRRDIEYVITGVANGFDQAVGWACVSLGIPFEAAVPFNGQESKWPPPARAKYQKLLKLARGVTVVCEDGYHPRKFIERDHWIVENSQKMLVLFDGQANGGTHETITYAQKKGLEVINLWDNWELYQQLKKNSSTAKT